MTDTPDYAAMSGGEFKHAVGVDPVQWAEAFIQREPDEQTIGPTERLMRLAMWFEDAMEAARVDERRYRVSE